MVILTLNCGSSSAKYQVYDWDEKDVLCVGVVERIGLEYSTIEQKSIGKEEYEERFVSPTHKEAIELILKMLVDEKYGCIKSLSEIGAVGHRVLVRQGQGRSKHHTHSPLHSSPSREIIV